MCISGTFSVPFNIVGSAAFNALTKFDSYISHLSPKKQHLEFINFVNIDKSANESLIAVFMRHLTESSQHAVPANGVLSNSASDTNVTSDDDSSSDIKVLQMSSPRSNCCVCGKSETGRHSFVDRPSCAHRCCTGCRLKRCNKCQSLAPAVAHSRNDVEPLNSLQAGSTRVQSSAGASAVDTVTNSTGVSPSLTPRRRLNSFSSYTPSSRTTTNTTDSIKAIQDDSNSKSENSNQSEDEFTPSAPRRRSRSLTRYDRDRSSERCVICMDKMTNPKKLDCGHVFCAECIEAAFAHAAKCPCCGRIFGKLKGNQPAGGTMKVRRSADDLAGYSGAGSIVIYYEIPSGFQKVALWP